MTLPILAKTWQITPNTSTPGLGGATTGSAHIARTIKNLMTSQIMSPWSVSGSSNAGGTTGSPTGSAGMDGVDRWTVDADIATGGSNNRHAWIVLRQTGIATNYELCWDFTNTGTLSQATFIVSPSAGFTGGSATARPTATDEIITLNNVSWTDGLDITHKIHYWQSTDGQCTRVMVWYSTFNLTTFWLFDRPQNPVSGWTNPSVTTMCAANTGFAFSYNSLSTGSISVGKGTTTMTVKWSGEGDTNNILAQVTNIGNLANDLDGSWPFSPIGLYSTTLGNKGRHGNLFDIWWKSEGLQNGDCFPADPTTRKFVTMGTLILPWTGDSIAPQIV